MQIKFLIVLLLFLLPLILYGRDSYTTGLKLKKADLNRISIEWLSSTNTGLFLVFRSTNGPIMNADLLTKSEMVCSVYTNGIPDKSLYRYPAVMDKIKTTGKYYYLVVQQFASYEKADFQATMNYNLTPVIITNLQEEPVTQEPVIVNTQPAAYSGIKNIFIKTNTGSFLVFWDVSEAESAQNHNYILYRTDYRLTNREDLSNLSPLKEMENEFYYEDFNIRYGIPYYYTVIMDTNITFQPGTNQNREPVFLGMTNWVIPVEKEIGQKTKVSKEDFQKQFK